MSEGQRGLEAIRARKLDEGIKLLDKALEQSNSPTWLLARAKAHYMLKNHDLALEDAEAAYHSAIERGSGNSRKLMIEAQYRRACCLFQYRRYADADCCAKWAMLLAEGRPATEDDGVERNVDEEGNYKATAEDVKADTSNRPNGHEKDGQDRSSAAASLALAGGSKTSTGYATDWTMAHIWRSHCVRELEKLPAGDAGRKVGVTKIPPKRAQRKVKTTRSNSAGSSADSDHSTEAMTGVVSARDVKVIEKRITREDGPVPEDKLKLRADFYQSAQNVTISFFAKDIKKDTLTVKFATNKVLIKPIPRENAPYLEAEESESASTILLSQSIDPAGSRFTVTPRKLELSLKKAVPEKWTSWGKEEIGDHFGEDREQTAAHPAEEAPKPTVPIAKAPAYPTSSKSGPKDWEKLASSEADDEDQDVNAFFKNLYKGSTDEQRRAMMKSFTESNGTALSTDWSDVGKRKVETQPPEGVEAKKW